MQNRLMIPILLAMLVASSQAQGQPEIKKKHPPLAHSEQGRWPADDDAIDDPDGPRGGESCAGDFDGNGSLDLFDFLAFQAAFGSDDLAADLTRDSVLNLFDFLEFLAAFGHGC